MQTTTVIIAMLLCFQVKHFVADYLLQPGWILRGKGDLRRRAAIPCRPACAGLAAGFCSRGWAARGGASGRRNSPSTMDRLHQGRPLERTHAGPDSRAYWALHGADQLMHQLTYVGLVAAAVA